MYCRFTATLESHDSNRLIQNLPILQERAKKETTNGRNRFLQKSAVSCENLRLPAQNLRFPVVFCANLRFPNLLIYRASRKSMKICKNLRKCAFRVPFAVSPLAHPDSRFRIADSVPISSLPYRLTIFNLMCSTLSQRYTPLFPRKTHAPKSGVILFSNVLKGTQRSRQLITFNRGLRS